MSWALAAGAVVATVGAVGANQGRQKAKGQIGKAAALGQQNLNLRQGDTRESVAEAMSARGLSGVSVGGPAAGTESYSGGPAAGKAVSVSGAHDLGGQATADLAREQQLEQTGLAQQVNNSYSDANAQADQGIINSITNGVSTAMGIKSTQALTQPPAGGTSAPAAIAGAAGAPAAPGTLDGATVRGAFGLHPLTAKPATGDFNVFSSAPTPAQLATLGVGSP